VCAPGIARAGSSTKKFTASMRKTIDALVQPEAGQIEHGLQHLRVMPVEFWLTGQKSCEVVTGGAPDAIARRCVP